jgi:hypothetical protein
MVARREETDAVAPDDLARFGRGVVAHVEALLGTDLVGAWFVGSIAWAGTCRARAISIGFLDHVERARAEG